MIDKTMAKRNGRTKQKNDLQNIVQITKDRATRTSLKIRGELRCSGSVSSSCSSRRITAKRHEHHMICKSYWTSV